MPLLNINPEKQDTPFSCWACSTRLAMNSYGFARYASDQELAVAVGLDEFNYQDVQTALNYFGMFGGGDSEAIPEFHDLKETIDKNCPIIICVTDKKPRKNQTKILNAHYILICGYRETAGQEIAVMDPDNGLISWINYDKTEYLNPKGVAKQYWGVTYYTKSPTSNV